MRQTTIARAALGLAAILLATSAFSQSPREQLQQLAAQLQKTPDDNALREKIIKLARATKPSPALPPEAERRMTRGGAAFAGATSAADYRIAAKEFEQATLAAPWYGDAYYNMAVAQDKAEDYGAALRSLEFAALASPGNKDVEKLSYAVEFRKEKAASPEARAAKQKLKDETLMKSLEGAVFTRMWTPGLEHQLRISNGRALRWQRKLQSNVCICSDVPDVYRCKGPVGDEAMCELAYSVPLNGRHGERRFGNARAEIEIAEDGQSLREQVFDPPVPTSSYTYKRR